MSRPKPLSEQLLQFLRGNLGKRALAPLTGTDYRALMAAAHLMAAYSGDPHPCYLEAFRLTVERMQRKCWYFAYHAIAQAMDWNDRMDLWLKAGLPCEPLEHMPRCEMEPGGAARPYTAAGETRDLIDELGQPPPWENADRKQPTIGDVMRARYHTPCLNCGKPAADHDGEKLHCVAPDGTIEPLTFR